MASVNKVILVGNLGRDPETRYNPEGGAITNISIATTDTWKDKTSGEKQERTEWHRVVFFSRLAEIAGEYLKKGSQVYIEGSLRTRKWQDKEGKERATQVPGKRKSPPPRARARTPRNRRASSTIWKTIYRSSRFDAGKGAGLPRRRRSRSGPLPAPAVSESARPAA